MKDEFPGVNFAVVTERREAARRSGQIVKRRGWTHAGRRQTPTARWSTSTASACCPTTVFSYAGGKVA